jgi:hypothetical protein
MKADNGCLVGGQPYWAQDQLKYYKGCLFFTLICYSSIICRLQY